jgi:Domain of unknown function (DUF1906)
VRTATGWTANAAKYPCVLLVSLTAWGSAAQAREYCANDPRVEAVDLSAPVDQGFLDTMQGIGIKTIIRYYDHEDETLPGKTLRREERNLIAANGFNTAVVFQHHNNQFASFTAPRAHQDAERSLILAFENSQPQGSAVYFGVDGPWQTAYEMANIASYFRELKAGLAGFGYRIGVYGSGLVCNMLLSAGLAELCWLGAPTSWPDYHAYYQTGNWGLAQLRPSQCGGRSVDFNLANDIVADYGQFAR